MGLRTELLCRETVSDVLDVGVSRVPTLSAPFGAALDGLNFFFAKIQKIQVSILFKQAKQRAGTIELFQFLLLRRISKQFAKNYDFYQKYQANSSCGQIPLSSRSSVYASKDRTSGIMIIFGATSVSVQWNLFIRTPSAMCLYSDYRNVAQTV